MLAVASLINQEGLAELEAYGAAGSMDLTTECISLSTASFDEMSPEAIKSIKKAMETHLRIFGSTYLALINIAFAKGMTKEACAAFQDAMNILDDRIKKMTGDQ